MTLLQRFHAKVAHGKANECWLWTAAKSVEGYGLFHVPALGRMVRAHRFSWTVTGRTIPNGMQLDHLCRTPSCVNPAHLELVTSRENTLRGNGPSAKNAKKELCPRGHAYSGVRSRKRRCGECERSQDRARYRRNAVPGLRGE
jgi:hypothetical protein